MEKYLIELEKQIKNGLTKVVIKTWNAEVELDVQYDEGVFTVEGKMFKYSIPKDEFLHVPIGVTTLDSVYIFENLALIYGFDIGG